MAAIELNISCPNVSGGVDFGADAGAVRAAGGRRAEACQRPIIAKLTPNVTNIAEIARGAEAGGADAISLINTCLGMAIDWRRRRPLLGNRMGGLSGPAIKPIALRAVHQVAGAVKTPLMGIGGIATLDDVMEFIVAGATAVQLGTVNFYDPTASMRILDALPAAISELKAASLAEIVGDMRDSPGQTGRWASTSAANDCLPGPVFPTLADDTSVMRTMPRPLCQMPSRTGFATFQGLLAGRLNVLNGWDAATGKRISNLVFDRHR